MLARTRAIGALAVLLLAMGLLFGAATTALATPPPTLGLVELRQMLRDSPDGTVDGYFKTVLHGQTIEEIPVTVLGTTGGELPGTSLILFEATGAKMESFGGIVAGMSGSPIYVDAGGTDKIIGAVSYGDYFTLGGTGLATPIESMLELQNRHPGVYNLNSPVIADGKVIERVIISPDPQDYAGADEAGALVAKPLNTVFVGGLRPGSTAYKMFSKALAAKGVSVAPNTAPLAAGPLDAASMVPTDLVPGAAVASLAARGDLWAGGIGTVTYNDGDDVLAFGHPDYWDGKTSLYMMNAWIDGVWPSQDWPYKLGSPTVVRGTIVQDRFAGILGHLNEFPAETTVTARVTNVDTGETTTSATYFPRYLLNTGKQDGYLVAASLASSAQKLIDSWMIAGSAQTTTTVTVSDGTDVFTLVMPNVYDSTELDWDVTWDAWMLIEDLQWVLESGTQQLDIMAVDFEMSYSEQRRNAQIAGVDVVGGLRSGTNTATVTYVAYGETDFSTQEVTFTIPAETVLNGTLTASSAYDGYYDYWDEYDEELLYWGSEAATPGEFSDWVPTVKSTVDDLAATQPNNVVRIDFDPSTSDDEEFESTQPVAIKATAPTPWFLMSSAELYSPDVMTMLMPSSVDYRGWTTLVGMVDGPAHDSEVSIYATPANSATESLVATVTAEYDKDSESGRFEMELGDYPTNTRLRVRVEPTDGWLSGDASSTIRVRPIIGLSASKTTLKRGKTLTLSTAVRPAANAGAQVAFQAWSSYYGEWRTVSTKTLVASGSQARASYSWKPTKSVKRVRVKFLGSTTSAKTTSSSIRIQVK